MIAKNAVEDILKDISEGIVEKYIGYIYPRLMKNEKKLFPKDRQECNSIMDAKNLYLVLSCSKSANCFEK